MSVRTLVVVTIGIGIADLAEDDHTGRAPINAECTARAHIVVDGEDDVILRIESWLFSSDGFVDSARRDHEDALPWADVDAALAHDALGLIDVNELLGLDGRRQPGRVNLLQYVVVPEFGHWGVRVGDRHLASPLAHQRTTEL